MQDRDARSKELFLEALALPPDQRIAFVQQVCGDDEALHRDVMELLAYDAKSDSRLESPVLDRHNLSALIRQPERIAGYRILGLLGRGGMGVVYLAEHAASGERVALKLLSFAASSPETQARFHREALVLRRLDHPGIARFRESGIFDSPDGPLPYLAMELVEGKPLTVAAIQRELPLRERLQLLVEICDAVAHAHAFGVVHRDLKPDNILVADNGGIKILDFGVSHVTGELDTGEVATRTGLLLGTPQYMSPEQARGDSRAVGPESDVYSLGVIAFELLASKPPYDAQSVSLHRAMVLILTAVPPRLGTLNALLAGELEHVVAHALEKNREDRYPNATAFADDLRRYLAGRRVAARPVGKLRRTARVARRHRLRTAAVAIVVVALAIASWAVRTRIASAPQVVRQEEVLASALDAVERADLKLFQGTRTREDLLEVIAVLERLRADLATIPTHPSVPMIRRYTLIRSGEATLFLGLMDHDPEQLLEALGLFTNAAESPWQPEALAALSFSSVSERIRWQNDLRPIALKAIANQALALYRSPVAHLTKALAERREVLHELQRPSVRGRRFATTEDSSAVLTMVFNDIGQSQVDLGATQLQLQLLGSGIDTIRRALTTMSMGWEDVCGSITFNLGVGFERLAEATRSAADADSALSWLQASLGYRTPDRRLVHVETQCALAETEMLRAALVDASRARSIHLDRALQHLNAAKDLLLPTDHPVDQALLQSVMAEVLAKKSLTEGRDNHVARADSLLDAAEVVLSRTRYPLQHARLQYRRAILAQVRWAINRDPKDRERADQCLRAAVELVPPQQDPRFHGLLQQLAAHL